MLSVTFSLAGVENSSKSSERFSADYQPGVAFNVNTSPGTSKFIVGFRTAGLAFAVYF